MFVSDFRAIVCFDPQQLAPHVRELYVNLRDRVVLSCPYKTQRGLQVFTWNKTQTNEDRDSMQISFNDKLLPSFPERNRYRARNNDSFQDLQLIITGIRFIFSKFYLKQKFLIGFDFSVVLMKPVSRSSIGVFFVRKMIQ